MVRLSANYRKNQSWWKSGGEALWRSTLTKAVDQESEKEIELYPSDAAQFLCSAAVIPGWNKEAVKVTVVADWE